MIASPIPAPDEEAVSLPAVDRQAAAHSHTRRANQAELAEDYVELIADLIDLNGEARVVELAERMGVTHATVIKSVQRLQREGLVTSKPYRSIFLTDAGRAMAEMSRRRHRIVLEFLKSIGVSDHTAELDAEGIEHHVSEETLTRLEALIRRLNGSPR
ncbi:MAG: manganese-binding transcriptional regulator MntR [Azospirillum sp.]|nr:manganese-binding transcriptional regulator MntR [Azospirillum sp.]